MDHKFYRRYLIPRTARQSYSSGTSEVTYQQYGVITQNITIPTFTVVKNSTIILTNHM